MNEFKMSPFLTPISPKRASVFKRCKGAPFEHRGKETQSKPLYYARKPPLYVRKPQL